MSTEDVQYENPLSRISSSSSFNDEERLFRYLFKRYNNRIRPVRNSSAPVNVALTFSLMQIHHLVSSSRAILLAVEVNTRLREPQIMDSEIAH